MPVFDELEHTADWAFRVKGRDLRELFERAALALFALQRQAATPSEHTRELEVSGFDRETLLVNWLNELLYLEESGGGSVAACSILEISDQHLRAQVGTSSGGQARRLIKAVTFHNLKLQHTAEGWEATVVVDV